MLAYGSTRRPLTEPQEPSRHRSIRFIPRRRNHQLFPVNPRHFPFPFQNYPELHSFPVPFRIPPYIPVQSFEIEPRCYRPLSPVHYRPYSIPSPSSQGVMSALSVMSDSGSADPQNQFGRQLFTILVVSRRRVVSSCVAKFVAVKSRRSARQIDSSRCPQAITDSSKVGPSRHRAARHPERPWPTSRLSSRNRNSDPQS